MPVRIQRKRTKGWRMPAGAIYVGRTGGEALGWSNPFAIGGYYRRGDPHGRGRLTMLYTQKIIWEPSDVGIALAEGYTLIETKEQAVEWYRWYVSTWSKESIEKCRRELGGRDLACWCSVDQPWCHANTLLEIANK